MTYTCRICKKDNLLSDEMKWVINYVDRCKKCWSEYMKNHRNKNKLTYIKYRKSRREHTKNWKLNKKYGISLEEYNKLKELQLGGCAICKQLLDDILKVDHNHITGKVRGLLCGSCNFALGLLKEDEDLIWNLLEYLKKHSMIKKRTHSMSYIQRSKE